MLPSHRVPTHPGEVLQEESLEPLGLTQVKLAAHIVVSAQRINAVTVQRRAIEPPRQRFTFRLTCRIVPWRFSIEFHLQATAPGQDVAVRGRVIRRRTFSSKAPRRPRRGRHVRASRLSAG
jgi:hypothetical protein